MAMTSVGIGGLVVGNAGAEEPPPSYVSGEDAGSELISPVSPVAPLEKSSTTPSQTAPYNRGAGTDVSQVAPSSPRAVEESATGSTSPVPQRPSRIPTEQRPTSSPTETPSSPGESPSEPSESPTESPSEPSESPTDNPSDPSESPTGSPSDPSESPTDSTPPSPSE